MYQTFIQMNKLSIQMYQTFIQMNKLSIQMD